MPKRTAECDEILEECGLDLEDRVNTMWLDLMLLQEDLLSLELPHSFSHFLLQDDDSFKSIVFKSIR